LRLFCFSDWTWNRKAAILTQWGDWGRIAGRVEGDYFEGDGGQ
jgi:hypothetical protein